MIRRVALLVVLGVAASACGPGEHAFSAEEASCVAVADRQWYAAAEDDVRKGLAACMDTSGWNPLDSARPAVLSFHSSKSDGGTRGLR